MADGAINVYLNDHLGGAMFGSNLAEQIRDQNEGTALGELMATIAPQIEEDRQTLIRLMEKLSRAKFGGLTSGEPELGGFMALETLCLGVLGKRCLWTALREVADQYPSLASADLDGLIARAEAQHDALERERIAESRRTFGQVAARSHA